MSGVQVPLVTPTSFLLDADVPVVVLAAEAAKNGKVARIPVPPALGDDPAKAPLLFPCFTPSNSVSELAGTTFGGGGFHP